MLRSAMRKPLESAGASVLLAAISSAALAGCAAHRKLVILSDPPGAAVRLDQKMVGETPYQTEFEAFGTRRVTLYREGYRTWSGPVKLVEPWYAQFPFDLFSEVLNPFGWSYHKELRVALEPEGGTVTQPDLQKVLDRAEVLRKAGPEGPQRAKPATNP
jgi:PEGA domain